MNKENYPEKDVLESIFELAQPRPVPPVEDEALVRAVVQSDWERMVMVRRRRRRLISFAAAASVAVVALTFGLLNLRPGAPDIRLLAGSVERTSGTVHTMQQGGSRQPGAQGGEVLSGSLVSTGADSYVAIDWHTNMSLLVDQNTRIAILSLEEIELLEGRVYLDTHNLHSGRGGGKLRIRAADATVEHVGTQFMTEFRNETLRTSVREGIVLIDSDGTEHIARAGREVMVEAKGTWTESIISTYGGDWEWTEDITPSLNMNGRPLIDIIDWVARETGRSVHFLSKQAKELAEQDSFEIDASLEPLAALQILTSGSDLRAQIDAGRIIVDIKPSQAVPSKSLRP